jgi:CheY-like chemotaxis protein
MGEEFANASVLYLDDQQEPLEDARGYFESKGLEIEITQSIDEAKSRAINNDLDVFVCDLRLDNISATERGHQILRFIRDKNSNVFLALYTAYARDLTSTDRKYLAENNIRVYGKEDNDEFLFNLMQDYEIFKKEQQQKSISMVKGPPVNIKEEVKQHVLKHLRNVSNQELVVPIPNHNDIKIKDLITEVTKDSPIGDQYMAEWLTTIALIQKIRKENSK